MRRLFLVGLLLACAQGVAAVPLVASDGSSLANSSEALLHRSKRSSFVPSPNCPEPIYLTQSQVSEWPGITVDTTQKTILDDVKGLNTFKCSDDTFFVYTHLPTVLTRQNWWIVCGTNLRNGWRVTDAGGRNTAYGMIPVGCVKPTCTGLQLFDGSESALASYPTYQVAPSKPTLVGINQKFQFTCPAGSTIGFAASATTITLDASMKIACEAEGWWMRTKSDLVGRLLSAKVGCFKQIVVPAFKPSSNCPALPMLTQTDVSPWPGVNIDTTSISILGNGINQFKCKPGAAFSYMKVHSPTEKNLAYWSSEWYMECDHTATNGWRVEQPGNPQGDYLNVTVGCIKSSCAVLLLFDGTESLLTSNPSYKLVPTTPSYPYDKFELACPSDCGIGYAETATKFTFEPTMKITCEAAGWWVKTSSNGNGNLLSPVKVGCFKKAFIPSANCPALPMLTQADISTLGGVTIDTTSISILGNGINQFKCKPGAAFSYMKVHSPTEKNLAYWSSDWYMECDHTATNGWRVEQPGNPQGDYLNVTVGCIKSSCAGLLLFDGTESLLTSNPSYKLVPTTPSYPNDKFELACPSDCGIGYAETATKFTFEPTMKITCEAAGWWVKTSLNGNGNLLSPVKVGCFRKAFIPSANCPVFPMLTQTDVSPFSGVTLDTTSISILDTGINQFKCRTGSNYTYISKGELAPWSSDWYMECDHTATNGWRVQQPGNIQGDYLNVAVGCIKDASATAAPTVPTTTATSGGLGELRQFVPFNATCRFPECAFRYYSSEEKKLVNEEYGCISQPPILALTGSCKTGKTRVQGYSARAEHLLFRCQKTGNNEPVWYSYTADPNKQPIIVLLPENPIIRCDGGDPQIP